MSLIFPRHLQRNLTSLHHGCQGNLWTVNMQLQKTPVMPTPVKKRPKETPNRAKPGDQDELVPAIQTDNQNSES